MGLDALDNDVLRFEIGGGFCGFADSVGGGDDGFVAIYEVSDVVLGGSSGDGHFSDARFFCKHGESARSEDVQSAEAFGDFVNGHKKFFVLRLERDVKLEKVRSFDIPMGEVSLTHQGVRISEESFQAGDDGVGFAGCGGLSAHSFSLS